MKKERLFFLVVLALLTFPWVNASSENQDPSPGSGIDSVVCDIRAGDEWFDCFCLITPKNGSIEEMSFFSDYDVELVGSDLQIDRVQNGSHRIYGFEKTGTADSKRIIVRTRGTIENHTMRLPIMSFPYRVDNTLLSVVAPEKKFQWKTPYNLYPLEANREEQVMASADFTAEDAPELNSQYLYLRSITTKSLAMPENRLYLGPSTPDQSHEISCWIGGEYEYYAPQIVFWMPLSVIFLLAVYYALRRMRKGKTPELEITSKQESPSKWEDNKTRYEETLKGLIGDEYTIYKELCGGRGEILQKALSEKTGLSGVKVTRVLNRLEQKGLIERKSYGMTNKVVLK
jgi:hypothetical protein